MKVGVEIADLLFEVNILSKINGAILSHLSIGKLKIELTNNFL